MVISQESLSGVSKYQLGIISERTGITPETLGIDADVAPSSVYTIEIEDPYVQHFSAEIYDSVKATEKEANDFAESRRLSGYWERKPGTAYIDENNVSATKKGWGDPISRDRFFNKTLASPAINAWRSKIPSAQALADLSDPINIEFIKGKNGTDVPVDHTAKEWLSLCTDAIAIRSRATVMADIVRSYVETSNELSENDYIWLSVACGTALPAMQGANSAGISPRLYLADFDNAALEATEQLAKEIGFTGNISTPAREALGKVTINIFDDEEMERLGAYLGDNGGRPRLLDLMGIFEYTGSNLGIDSAKFLRTCYNMLHPGGKLIFGQMRSDRPVPDFVTGVVGWPYVEMRSPNDFMKIIAEAGISPTATELYLPNDGVYTVGVISKP